MILIIHVFRAFAFVSYNSENNRARNFMSDFETTCLITP